MIIDAIFPQRLTAIQWTDAMSYSLAAYGPVYKLSSEEGWKDWAAYVVNLPNLAILSPPNPADFSDWREWAQRFIGALS